MSLDPKRFQAVLMAAAELDDPAERAAWLHRECGDDTELRQKIEQILHTQSSSEPAPIAPPATVVTGKFTPEDRGPGAPAETPGTTIAGKYKLLEQIGEGGMGTVWMAQQQEPVKRLVALKLIKAGMDSKAVLTRFEAERQALALMDHPNIAKVLDAGSSESGSPFFVMELVKGVPITRFCDERKLPPRERLELFVGVCLAIQHAHQKGIIHRDIKPSNVLVACYDDKPAPRVIDFGIAKATGQQLTEATLVTGFGTIVGTPEYMSPEQAMLNQLDVDTRSDIYSLGILLYELLTGSPPFRRKEMAKAGMLEVLRIIREEEPPKPSTRLSTEALPSIAANRGTEPARLTRLVRGEIDWIVMKALEKDRSRRYETANGFAVDIQRYLADEPVQAGPPSARYRLGKFARKNRRLLAAVCVFVVLLAAGTAVSTWQAFRARRAETTAHQERDAAEAARDREIEARRAATEARAIAQQEARRAGYNLYVSQVQLAQRCWNDSDPNTVRRLLSSAVNPHAPANRGPEWRFLHSLTREALRSIDCAATAGPVFSPDGRRVATGHRDHLVRIFAADTLEQVQTLRAAGGAVRALAFSADGRTLHTVAPAMQGDGPDALAVLRDFDLAAGSQVRATRVPRSKQFYRFDRAIFSPDARVVALDPSQHSMILLDVKTARPLRTLVPGDQTSNSSFTFSLDGKLAAWGDGIGKRLMIWDVGNGRLKTTHSMPEGIPTAIAFHPGGREVVAGDSQGNLTLWDVETGKKRYSTHLTASAIVAVVYRPDGKQAAIADVGRQIVIADARTGKPLRSIRGHDHAVTGLAFHPDGRRLLAADREQLRVWDSQRDQGMTVIRSIGSHLAYSPDGRALAVTARYATDVLDGETGERLASVGAYTGFGGFHACVAFGPDGRQLATLSGDGSVRIWDISSGVRRHVFGQRRSVGYYMDASQIVFDRPRNRVVAWLDGGIKVWDAATGRVSRTLKTRTRPNCLAVHPEGGLLAAGLSDGAVELWDLRSGQSQGVLAGHAGAVLAVAFAPHGRHLATGGADRTVRIRDVAKRSTVGTLEGHAGTVTAVTFSPDGSRLATGSTDATVRLWDSATRRELLVLGGHTAGVTDLAFRPDGAALASIGADGKILIRHFPDPAASADRLANYLAERLVEELMFADTVGSAIDARDDWPASLKTAVRIAAAGRATTPEQMGPKLWRFVQRGGGTAENARAVRIAEALSRRLPADPSVRRCLAYALYRTGQTAKGLATVAEAGGPDDETLRILACLRLGRVQEAKRAMERLRKAIRGTDWANGPLARSIAEGTLAASLKPARAGDQGEWDSLLGDAISLLGEDLDHDYTMGSLRHAHGEVLGQQGQSFLDRKDFVSAERALTKSVEVLKKARDALNQQGRQGDQVLVVAINRLARLYEATGRRNEAAKLREEQEAILRKSDPSARLVLADALVRAGQYKDAMSEASKLAVHDSLPGYTLYNLACVVALSAAGAGRDAARPLPEREKQAEVWTRQALGLLQRASTAGFFEVRLNRAHLDKDSDLDVLRGRDDYTAFVKTLPGHQPETP